VSIERVSKRRIDVESGKVIRIDDVKTDDLDELNKYVQMKEDREDIVKKRYHLWNEHVQKIEEAYKKVLLNIQTDIKSELITDLIADAIQNPIY
jgi:adenylate kinase family enzyme